MQKIRFYNGERIAYEWRKLTSIYLERTEKEGRKDKGTMEEQCGALCSLPLCMYPSLHSARDGEGGHIKWLQWGHACLSRFPLHETTGSCPYHL